MVSVVASTSCGVSGAGNPPTPEPGSLDRSAWLDEYDEPLLIPLLSAVEALADDIDNGMSSADCEAREQAHLDAFGPDGAIPAIDTFKAGSEDIATAGNNLMEAAFWLLAGCIHDDDIAHTLGRDLSITAPQKFDNVYQRAANEAQDD